MVIRCYPIIFGRILILINYWVCHMNHICYVLESHRDKNRLHPGNTTERKAKADWGRNSGQLATTWAQLEPNWDPTWRNLGMIGCSMRNLVLYGSIWCQTWAKDMPGRCKFSACGMESAKLARARVGRQLELKLAPLGHVGLKLIQVVSRWKPSDAHGNQSQV